MNGEYNVKLDKVEIKKAYNLYSNFKQKILNVAYEELKEKGDYYFEYDEIKTGRSVSSINFHIITNKEKVKEEFKENESNQGEENNVYTYKKKSQILINTVSIKKKNLNFRY